MDDKKIEAKKPKDFNKKQKPQQKDVNSKDVNTKELNSKEINSKDVAKDVSAKDVNAKNTNIVTVAPLQSLQNSANSTPAQVCPPQPELKQELAPPLNHTEQLKTAIMRNNRTPDVKSQNPTAITVDTNAPNYNSKMLLAVLQNRKNQMLEGKRVLCTERVIPAEDIKRHTQGFIIVPRDQWENITPGSYIIYMGYDNNYRNGGYIKYKYEKNNIRYFQIETKQGRKTNDPSYISFPVAYDEIKTLFKKIDPSAIVEINLIKKDLANKRDNIEYLNKKMIEEIQARKNLENKIDYLEKENKKIKTLLKMLMTSPQNKQSGINPELKQ